MFIHVNCKAIVPYLFIIFPVFPSQIWAWPCRLSLTVSLRGSQFPVGWECVRPSRSGSCLLPPSTVPFHFHISLKLSSFYCQATDVLFPHHLKRFFTFPWTFWQSKMILTKQTFLRLLPNSGQDIACPRVLRRKFPPFCHHGHGRTCLFLLIFALCGSE